MNFLTLESGTAGLANGYLSSDSDGESNSRASKGFLESLSVSHEEDGLLARLGTLFVPHMLHGPAVPVRGFRKAHLVVREAQVRSEKNPELDYCGLSRNRIVCVDQHAS